MKHVVKGCLIKYNRQLHDGRIVKPDAFKDQDGAIISVMDDRIAQGTKIGTAILECREDGLYYTAELDDLDESDQTIDKIRYHTYRFGMYANHLKQQNNEILFGIIRAIFSAVACDACAYVTEIDGEPLEYSQEKIDEIKSELGELSTKEILLEAKISKTQKELEKVQNRLQNLQYILKVYDKEWQI